MGLPDNQFYKGELLAGAGALVFSLYPTYLMLTNDGPAWPVISPIAGIVLILAGLMQNKGLSIAGIVLATLAAMANASLFLVLAIITHICDALEAHESDVCTNFKNSAETCYWRCDTKEKCEAGNCKWDLPGHADSCMHDVPSSDGMAFHLSKKSSYCEGCANDDSISLCDHLLIINACVGLTFVLVIVGASMACCIVCCGKGDTEGDDDSGVQELER